ncbi:serine hydrolase domain-containing protein [Geodermatophilus marinus]|uniref:serine hydrolase domain-containing protein n=1 Tax=Geodermatophilus sp. LHW52908 TaxID=2303986 RepID=UPI00131451EB|nr:serine hydrolase domain-containing protein [Geodermatophilus sp. LHW52908]
MAATGLLAALIASAACGGADETAAIPTPTATRPSGPTAPPAADSDLQQTMTGILEAHRADDEFVGAVLALRTADGTAVTTTAGAQSLDVDSDPVDPDVPWNIGSATKPFVAVVVLQLAEEGRLDLDTGIEDFLPDLAGADRITPRQLLQHTSGLGDYIHQPAVLDDARREWTPAELIALAETAGRTGGPGGPHSYSNTNYTVLGEIIEQVTGNPWTDEVHERIVEPLDLQGTRLGSLRGVPGYVVDEGRLVEATDRWHPSVGGAAGALESTAADLLVFTEALRDGRLLSEQSQAEMGTFIPAEDLSQFGIDHRYGLGFEEYASEQLTVHGHLGSGSVHSAFFGFDPDSGAAVAVLMNVETSGPQAFVAFEALAAVHG